MFDSANKKFPPPHPDHGDLHRPSLPCLLHLYCTEQGSRLVEVCNQEQQEAMVTAIKSVGYRMVGMEPRAKQGWTPLTPPGTGQTAWEK